jgi:Kef-type K+ transport system membrane component KefB
MKMDDLAATLLVIGALFLVGLAIDGLANRTRLPRVTLLIVFGVGIGGSGLDLLAPLGHAWFRGITSVALAMVGFLLGQRLTLEELRRHGRAVLAISAAAVVATAAIVFLGLTAMDTPVALALLLAGVATATAPAATSDVVQESGADGPRTQTLLGVVAVDDAWCILLFSLLLAAAQVSMGGSGAGESLIQSAIEIAGAIAVGGALGLLSALLAGPLRAGERTFVAALGLVFLCSGISLAIGASFLLASIVMGAVVANLTPHEERWFGAIRGVERPFLILFFVLSGAELQVGGLGPVAVLLAGYVALRALGRLLGGWIGGVLAGADAPTRRWMGVALMPQAGVALGLALVASQRFPALEGTLLPVAIGATIVFELGGPIATRTALARFGEFPARGSGPA